MWTHKKHGKKQFKGQYIRTQFDDGTFSERTFVLSYFDGKKRGKMVTFESWQAAKALGWAKVK